VSNPKQVPPLDRYGSEHTSSAAVVLVVDDEELLRLHAADLLEEEGFEVIEAPNAEAALQVLASRPDVRLLFTDIHMPGPLDGMDLARRVHERWPHVLLVVTSGRGRPSDDEIPDAAALLPSRTALGILSVRSGTSFRRLDRPPQSDAGRKLYGVLNLSRSELDLFALRTLKKANTARLDHAGNDGDECHGFPAFCAERRRGLPFRKPFGLIHHALRCCR